MKEINISSEQKGQRLDKYLMKYMNNAPRSFIYKMLRKKNIKLNNKKALGSEILAENDNIKLFLSDETIHNFMSEKSIKPAGRDFEIIYEDENIIICNKPAGLICHPDNEHRDNTLNDQLLYYLYQKGEYDVSLESDFTPSICNRLDRNTSGIVVMGKNLEAVQELNRAFRERLVDKFYIAAVKGRVENEGKVEGRHSKKNGNVAEISDKGKYILTKYKPLHTGNEYSILEIKLETGKSHQIRVCMAYINHPIIGDNKYGDAVLNRFFRDKFNIKNQILHSGRIVFKLKSGRLKYLYNREFKAGLWKNENSAINYLYTN